MKANGPLLTRSRGLALGLLLLPGVVRPATAAPSYRKMTRSYQRTVGNSDAGAALTFEATASNTASTSLVRLRADADILLLKRTGRAVRAEASAANNGGYGTASVRVELAGMTVLQQSKSTSWSLSVTKPVTFFQPPGAVVMVGPVPVTVKASAGGGLRSSLGFGISPSGVAVSGGLGVWASGSASAKLGIPGYSIAVAANLTLFDSSLNSGLEASFSALRGSLTLAVEPATLVFSLILRAWPLPDYTKDLARFAYPKVTQVLLQL